MENNTENPVVPFGRNYLMKLFLFSVMVSFGILAFISNCGGSYAPICGGHKDLNITIILSVFISSFIGTGILLFTHYIVKKSQLSFTKILLILLFSLVILIFIIIPFIFYILYIFYGK